MRVGGHFVTCIGLRAGVPDGHKLDSVPTVGRAARSFTEVCERPLRVERSLRDLYWALRGCSRWSQTGFVPTSGRTARSFKKACERPLRVERSLRDLYWASRGCSLWSQTGFVPTIGRTARSFKEACERPQTLRKIFFRQRSQLGRKQTAVKARAKRSDVTSVESWKANRWR